MELKTNQLEIGRAVRPGAALQKGEIEMKALQITLTVLAWIAVGFALWAIFPLLVKVFALASKLHNSWI